MMIDLVGWHQHSALQNVDSRLAHRAITIAKFRAKVYLKGSVILRQAVLLALFVALLVMPNWGAYPIQLLLIPGYLLLTKVLNVRAYRRHALPLLADAVDDASRYPLKGR